MLLIPWLLELLGHYLPRHWLYVEGPGPSPPQARTSSTCIILVWRILSNLYYKSHQIPKLECFWSCLAVVFAQNIEARCYVKNEDVVRGTLTGDAPTSSEWSKMLLPTMVQFILEVWYIFMFSQRKFNIRGIKLADFVFHYKYRQCHSKETSLRQVSIQSKYI